MDAWPIEEVWLRPVLTLAVCGALPLVATRALSALLGPGTPALSAAAALARTATLAFAWAAGATALGPALVSQPDAWPSHLFGACAVTVAVLGGERARRVSARSADDAPDGIVPRPSWAIAATASLPMAVAALAPAPSWPFGAVALLLGAAALEARGLGAAAARESHGLMAGATVATLIGALALLPWALTDIAEEHASDAGASAATWRLRVHPWDAGAMLAAAWGARDGGHLRLANARATAARRMGADAAATLELEAEVLAAEGRCDEARARFDEALEARAADAFEGALTEPLTLGGYRLPPSLLTECGGLDPGPAR